MYLNPMLFLPACPHAHVFFCLKIICY